MVGLSMVFGTAAALTYGLTNYVNYVDKEMMKLKARLCKLEISSQSQHSKVQDELNCWNDD